VRTGTTAGTYSGTLTATPNTGSGASTSYSLVVNAALTPPALSLSGCSSITPTTSPTAASMSCTLSNSGQTAASAISYGSGAGASVTGPASCAANATCGTVKVTTGTTAGTYSGTLTATPNTGSGTSAGYSLVVNAALTPPALSLTGCTSVTPTTSPTAASMSCTVSNTGQTAATAISYGTGANTTVSGPTGGCAANTTCGTVKVTTGTSAGSYSGTVTATPNTGTAGSANYSLTVASAPLPTLTVTRTPLPMTAGQGYTVSWTAANATSVSYSCESSTLGYIEGGSGLAVTGSKSGTANSGWVSPTPSCTWTATGAGGTKTVTEPMTTVAGEVVTYIHTDGLGSPVAKTDQSGNVISRTRYEPYGLTAAGATPTLGFTGHVNDQDTGLTYMQQRYYDPVAGRFLSIDPVTTDENSGGNFNRYWYADNNPYKKIDPDGRFAAHAIAFSIGFAIDVGVQHWVENKSWDKIDYKGAAITGVGAAITGGVGAKLAQQAIQGTITAANAVAKTAAVGAVSGAAGSAATDLANGEKVNAGKVALGAAGGAVGAAIGAKVDNAAAAMIGKLSSSGGVMSHIGDATRPSVNFGNSVKMGESAGQAVGKVGADAAVSAGQKAIEQKVVQ